MQWQSFMIWQRKGIISLSVLLFSTVILTIFQGFFFLITRESETQLDDIRQEQVLNLGESLIKIAVRNEEQGKLSSAIQLKEIKLYPGNEEVTAEITTKKDIQLGVRQIKIVLESADWKWQLYEDKLLPPGGAQNKVYQNAIYAQDGISGSKPNGVSIADGSNGSVMPLFDVSAYKQFCKMVLPTAKELSDYGLKKRLYFNTSSGNSAYSVIENTIIKGDGVLVDEAGITIKESCRSIGNLWLISGSGIVIEDNVQLDKALIIAKKNVSIGNNVSISGIIISGGKVTVGNNLIMTRDKKVLEPFLTACYFL
ncbi:MAG: hypothetical protein ACRC8T_08935 [Acidaminococcaceae bacterium]